MAYQGLFYTVREPVLSKGYAFNKTGSEQACNRAVEESVFIKALSLYNEWQ